MDAQTLIHRDNLAQRLLDIRTAVSDMLTYWETNDLDPDILVEEEYPFTRSLEDLHSEIVHSAEVIRERNERIRAYRPPTLTKRELIDMLEAVDCPDDTPILGYTEVTDYVNVDGLGNTDFEGGPALVIETLQNYDPRQF